MPQSPNFQNLLFLKPGKFKYLKMCHKQTSNKIRNIIFWQNPSIRNKVVLTLHTKEETSDKKIRSEILYVNISLIFKNEQLRRLL